VPDFERGAQRTRGLNRGQAGDLQISLTMADRAMRLLEALLLVAEDPEAIGKLQGERDDEAVVRLRALARRFRDEVRCLMDELGLAREDRDLRPLLTGQVQRARDCVDGSLVASLAGYGPLDPQIESFLRPRVAALLILANDMLKEVGEIHPQQI